MSDHGYSWRNTRHTSSYLLPKSEHFGLWIVMAVILGIVFHFLLFLALEKVPVIIKFLGGEVEEVSVPSEIKMTTLPPRELKEVLELNKVAPPSEDLLEVSQEIAELEDVMEDVIITPEIEDSLVDIKIEAPALSGQLLSEEFEKIKGPEIELDSPEIGQNEDLLTDLLRADIKLDTGRSVADDFDPDEYTKNLLKRGAEGTSREGLLEGFSTLEQMKEMTGNALENAKALIGSDLLFEFGKAELKTNARHSLMAVAYLIDKNPELFCILNGHTDLFGSEAANKELSLKRAKAVKDWLENSLLLEGDRIIVVGHGMNQPIVENGDKEEQALNRRVVVEMKKKAPILEAPVEVEEEEIPVAIPAAREIIPQAVEEIPRAIPE